MPKRTDDKSASGPATEKDDTALAVDPWNAAIANERTLDISEFPGALLLRVANVVHAETTAIYARRHGLTVPEWRILARLYGSSPIKLATLCRVSYFDKAQVTRVLASLSNAGLARTFPDASHKKRRIVEITQEGRDLAEKVFPDAVAAQKDMLGKLTAEERNFTYTIIWKLLKAYGVEKPKPAEAYREASSEARLHH